MNTMGSNITWGLMLAIIGTPCFTHSWADLTLDHFIYGWVAITTVVWIVRSWIRSAS